MKILIAGDYCTCGRDGDTIYGGNYVDLFEDVRNVICNVDYSIVNLECPVVENNSTGIKKLGPHLKCRRESIEALKWMGFDCVTLANNHFLDYGPGGVKDTFDVVDELGLDRVGAGMNSEEASTILYKEINGEKIAIVNCCEHEFSISTDIKPGCNGLVPIRQYYAIQEAHKNADFVLVIVHGGHEHWQLPSPRMQETYRFFIDVGADAVVNHHQHCFSGYERYNGKMIFYGLGNFYFYKEGKVDNIWNQGYMAIINSDDCGFKIVPYEQCNGDGVGVRILDPEFYHDRIDELNTVICSYTALRHATDQYYSHNFKNIRSILNPIQNRWIKGAMNRGWIADGLSKKWLVTMENFILCEAHRDKIEYFFRNDEYH